MTEAWWQKDQDDVMRRFMQLVEKEDPAGCWIWKGKFGEGTPRFSPRPGKVMPARRFIFIRFVGAPLDETEQLAPACAKQDCVNPEHQRLYFINHPYIFRCGHDRIKENQKMLKSGRVRCLVCYRNKQRREVEKRSTRSRAEQDASVARFVQWLGDRTEFVSSEAIKAGVYKPGHAQVIAQHLIKRGFRRVSTRSKGHRWVNKQKRRIDPNSYPCGHERSPSNSYKNGKYLSCRECALARRHRSKRGNT